MANDSLLVRIRADISDLIVNFRRAELETEKTFSKIEAAAGSAGNSALESSPKWRQLQSELAALRNEADRVGSSLDSYKDNLGETEGGMASMSVVAVGVSAALGAVAGVAISLKDDISRVIAPTRELAGAIYDVEGAVSELIELKGGLSDVKIKFDLAELENLEERLYQLSRPARSSILLRVADPIFAALGNERARARELNLSASNALRAIIEEALARQVALETVLAERLPQDALELNIRNRNNPFTGATNQIDDILAKALEGFSNELDFDESLSAGAGRELDRRLKALSPVDRLGELDRLQSLFPGGSFAPRVPEPVIGGITSAEEDLASLEGNIEKFTATVPLRFAALGHAIENNLVAPMASFGEVINSAFVDLAEGAKNLNDVLKDVGKSVLGIIGNTIGSLARVGFTFGIASLLPGGSLLQTGLLSSIGAFSRPSAFGRSERIEGDIRLDRLQLALDRNKANSAF